MVLPSTLLMSHLLDLNPQAQHGSNHLDSPRLSSRVCGVFISLQTFETFLRIFFNLFLNNCFHSQLPPPNPPCNALPDKMTGFALACCEG